MIPLQKQGSSAGGKVKPVSSDVTEKENKKKKKRKKKKKKKPAQESGSQDSSSGLEKEATDEGDGVSVQELNGEQVKKGKKRKRQQSKAEEVVQKRNKYDSTVYHGANQNGQEKVDVSEWEKVFVPSPVLEALAELGFSHPTSIQVGYIMILLLTLQITFKMSLKTYLEMTIIFFHTVGGN